MNKNVQVFEWKILGLISCNYHQFFFIKMNVFIDDDDKKGQLEINISQGEKVFIRLFFDIR